jgi:hypothetical protein
MFQQAHLTEELLAHQFGNLLLILLAVVDVDANAAVGELIDTIACVTLAENDLTARIGFDVHGFVFLPVIFSGVVCLPSIAILYNTIVFNARNDFERSINIVRYGAERAIFSGVFIALPEKRCYNSLENALG